MKKTARIVICLTLLISSQAIYSQAWWWLLLVPPPAPPSQPLPQAPAQPPPVLINPKEMPEPEPTFTPQEPISPAIIPPITPPDENTGGNGSIFPVIPGHRYLKETDAFSMMGDSRTQLIIGQWHDQRYLGQFRSGCSNNKTTIQNFGASGSRTDNWLNYIKTGVVKPEEFHQRVVLMLGGNDVLQNFKQWTFPWGGIHTANRDRILNGIHRNFKELVLILRSWGKEVLVQKHFNSRPGDDDAFTKNEGLFGLNERLEKTYTAGMVMTSPGKWYIRTWKQACGCIGYGKAKICGCIHVPVTVWEPPKFEFNPGVAGVSLVPIGPWLMKDYFVDSSHLNDFGYEVHSRYLKDGLLSRCWW